MSGRTSRSKGEKGKVEVAKLFIALGYKEAKNSGLVQAGKGGGKRIADVFDIGRWWCEVKLYADITDGMVTKWWLKLVQECPKTHDPVLVYKEQSRTNRGNSWMVQTKEHERPISWSTFAEEEKRRKRRARTPKG